MYGVALGDDGPELKVSRPDGTGRRAVALAGARLAYRVIDKNWCLGHRDADGIRHACPARAQAVRAHRCERCEAADPFRWLHIVHRSAFVDPALREHISRPHWLYVATFGPGLHKVGTAVQERRWTRVAEQGPLAASYVATVPDGIEVRRLEDLVTARAGLGQVVRPAAKVAALLGGATPQQVAGEHRAAVARATQALADHDVANVRAEPWLPDPDPADLLAGQTLHPFPGSPDHGVHGYAIQAVIGSAALIGLGPQPDETFVADLATLKGARIAGADAATPVPAVQPGLF